MDNKERRAHKALGTTKLYMVRVTAIVPIEDLCWVIVDAAEKEDAINIAKNMTAHQLFEAMKTIVNQTDAQELGNWYHSKLFRTPAETIKLQTVDSAELADELDVEYHYRIEQ